LKQPEKDEYCNTDSDNWQDDFCAFGQLHPE